MRRFPAYGLCLYALFATSCGIAFSQDSSTPLDTVVVELPESVVKARRAQPVQSRETVSSAWLERNNRGTLAASLDALPGLSMLSVGVGISKPVIRGLSNHRILVIDQGVKQEGQQWGADHGLEIDPFSVSSLEILKGPASLRYGSDGLAGAIRLNAPPLPAGDSTEGESALLYKSNNAYGAVATKLAHRRGSQGLTAHASLQSYADYRVPADSFTYNSYRLSLRGNRLKNTAGREANMGATWRADGAWGEVGAGADLYDLDAGLFPGAVGVPREYQLTDDGDARDRDVPKQTVRHLKIRSHQKFYYDRWEWELGQGYQQNDRGEYSFPHAHDAVAANGSTLAHGMELQTWSGEGQIRRRLGEGWKATAGTQGQWQRNLRSGFEYLLPDYARGQGGLYGLVEGALSPEWRFEGGVRWDGAWTRTSAHSIARPDSSVEERAPRTERTDYNLSYAAGAMWEPLRDRLDFRLNLGKSFRIPHPSETVSNGVHHGSFRHERGEPNLVSETGYQADLMGRVRSGPWTFSLSPFLWYFRGYIYLTPTGRFSDLPDAGQIYQYRQNDALFTGAEWTTRYEAGAWAIHQDFEAVWNVNLDTRLPLPFTPPWSLLHGVEWTPETFRMPFVLERGMTLRLQSHWTAAQGRVDRNEDPTSGYHLMNAGLSLRAKIGAVKPRLEFEAQNLADARYQNHLSRYRLLNLPEQGRNFVFRVTLPWNT